MRHDNTVRHFRSLAVACLLGALLLALGAAAGCKKGAGDAAHVTVRVESVHAALPLPSAMHVKLGERAELDKTGASPLEFDKVPPGEYGVHVEGPFLVDPTTLHVDAKGAGDVTVKVAPIETAPVVAASLPAGAPKPPTAQALFIDLTNATTWIVYWRQDAVMVARTSVGANDGKLPDIVAAQWKEREEGLGVHGAVIVVDEHVAAKSVGAAAEAIARARGQKPTPLLEVRSKADVEPKPLEAHPFEKSTEPTDSKPLVRLGAVSTAGPIPQEVLDSLFRAAVPMVAPCYWGALASNPTMEGRVVVRFVIGIDGKPSNFGASGDLPSPEVGECMSRVLARIAYPKPEGTIQTSSVPFMMTLEPKRK